jgi:aconitate hydratase 2/2-methylisocitrate dehydratase
VGLTLLYLEKKLQTFASKTLGIDIVPICSVKVSIEGQGLTAVEKIFNKTQLVQLQVSFTYQFCVRVTVKWPGSQIRLV